MTNSNNLNLLHLEGLTPQEKEYALKILSELSNNRTDTYSDLLYADYKEIPVDIETFLTDDNYLGQAWKDAGGKLKLYDFWLDRLKELFPNNIDTAYNTLLESGARGLGKEQNFSAPVLTEHGFIPMGEVKVGTRTYGKDGKLHNVIAVFPQGMKDVYEMTFSDGSKTTCGLEHLWQVTDHHYCLNHKHQGPTKRVLNTQQLINYSLNVGQNRFSIPLCEPIQFPHNKNTLIDPYLLGCLLGDGHLGQSITITSKDEYIINYFNDLLVKDNYHLTPAGKICFRITSKTKCSQNLYKEYLKELGLLDTTSETKFIPKEYLYSDIESRIALLQGLMDTDGTASKARMRNGKGFCASATFSTVSEQLKDDIIWLVQSLGGVARYIKKDRNQYHYVNKNKGIDEYRICKPHYRISIKLPSKIEPFRLKRKLDIYHLQKHSEPSRYIISIQKLPEQEQCQCILVDAEDHLYITNEFIVTHNSEIACGCVGTYLMYRVMCLKNPLEYFHLKQTEKICFAFMNIKLALAEEIAISKFQKTIQMSPWFMSKGTMTSYHNKPYWNPPDPIKIIIGSQSDDVIGQPVYYSFFDEISFIKNQDIDKQKAKAKDMIDTAIGGMMTRFVHGGKNPTMLVVASSKRSEQSFMEEYIKMLSKTEGNSTMVIDKPVWEVKPKGTYSDETFLVGLGNKYLESIVIPDDEYSNIQAYKDRGYQILEVPIDFKSKFLEDIERNLCDFAGISSSSASKYIAAAAVLSNIHDDYKNPFPDILEIGNAPDDTAQYYNFFNLDNVPKDLLYKPLYIHLDMSVTGDMTGIAGVWIIGKKVSTDPNLQDKDLQFRLAFSVSIKAPKGRQISFEKNRNFIRWLKSQGFKIAGISSDTYQSVDTGQQLTAEGFNYKVLSVDRVDNLVCVPYQYLRSTIYEKRLDMYRSERLFDEAISVERNNNTGKVDHPPNGHKDVLDAVAGATYNASRNAEQYAFDYGEDIELTNSFNTDSESNNQQQMIVDFEAEMMKLLDPIDSNYKKEINKPDQSTVPLNAYLYDGIVVF